MYFAVTGPFLKKRCFPNIITFFQALIVITDGKQTTAKAYTELSVASQGVKNKGVAVYAVGVGKGADAAELREIASSQENVFVSASFKELQPITVELRKRLCDCKFLTTVSKISSVTVNHPLKVNGRPKVHGLYHLQTYSSEIDRWCLTKNLIFIFLSIC